MLTVQQGDQYAVAIEIVTELDGVETKITPSNCTDVTIEILGVEKSYLEEEITYDSTNQVWEYPLTEEQTESADLYLSSWQVKLTVGTDIMYSSVETMGVRSSIITGA